VEVMEAWEKTKHQFDPSDLSDDPANSQRIIIAPLALFLGGDALQNSVHRYNEAHGSSIEYNRRGYLMIPVLQMQTFFTKVINKIVSYLPLTSPHWVNPPSSHRRSRSNCFSLPDKNTFTGCPRQGSHHCESCELRLPRWRICRVKNAPNACQD